MRKGDYYTQAGELSGLMNPAPQQRSENTVRSWMSAAIAVQKRNIRHCVQADRAYGDRVANAPRIVLSGASE